MTPKIITIEDIKKSLLDLGPYGFVMDCEEKYHDLITQAVKDIIGTVDTKRIIFIAGPSGSAKTTTANRLREQLENYNIPTLRISMDDYFLPLNERTDIKNLESPDCVDWNMLMEHIPNLLNGKKVRSPKYNFARGTSEYGPTISLPYNGVIICEGIHALNSDLFNKFKGQCKGIYVAPRTRITDNENSIFHPQNLRLVRRILRDSRTRGRNIQQIIKQAESVDEGEKLYIEPFKEKASIHINTFLDYELCIMAKILTENRYIDELNKNSLIYKFLYNVPKGISEIHIPNNSILKEFIG